MTQKMGLLWWSRFLFVVTIVSMVLVFLEFVTWPLRRLYRLLFPPVAIRPDLPPSIETI